MAGPRINVVNRGVRGAPATTRQLLKGWFRAAGPEFPLSR